MATLEITTRIGCKNNCSYCPQGPLINAYKKRSGQLDMSFENFKTCIDKIPQYVRIDFSGMAEPWLNPYCTEMVEYAHEKGFDLAVYTTLVGMKNEDIERIAAIPFRKFEVHLPDERHLTQIKVNRDYLQKLQKIITLKIQGLSFMTIGKLHAQIRKITGNNKVSENKVISRAGNLENYPGMDLLKRLTGIVYCDSCGSDFNHNVLLPNGDVIVCCMDYSLQYIIGNLTRISYAELFKSDTIREMREKLIDDKKDILCRYCYNASRSKLNWLPGAATIFKKYLLK